MAPVQTKKSIIRGRNNTFSITVKENPQSRTIEIITNSKRKADLEEDVEIDDNTKKEEDTIDTLQPGRTKTKWADEAEKQARIKRIRERKRALKREYEED